MKDLVTIAEKIAAHLIERRQTIAVAESSTGGLMSETGATGPTGNRYGDAAGHSCMAVAGPQSQVITLETGSNERLANMQMFASTALNLLLQNLSR